MFKLHFHLCNSQGIYQMQVGYIQNINRDSRTFQGQSRFQTSSDDGNMNYAVWIYTLYSLCCSFRKDLGTCDTQCEAFIVDRMMMRRSLRKKASSQSSAAQLQPVMSVQLFGLSFNLRSTIALCHHLFLCKLQTMIMIIWFLGCLYRVVLQGSAVLTLHC